MIAEMAVDTTAGVVVVFPPTDDLISGLGREGLEVRVAPTLAAAVQEILTRVPAAVVLLAQDETAVESCAVLRALGDFPIVVSPQPLASATIARCLDAGADLAFGYPTPPLELAVRLQSLLERGPAGEPVRAGPLVVDLREQVATLRGRRLDLTPTEFRLLGVLAENLERVVPTHDLLRQVWGNDYIDEPQYVRLYIGYLRAKIEDDRSNPRYIITQRSVGYRLQNPASAEGAV